MTKEILTIHVRLTGMTEVKGQTGEALMITFDGTAEGPLFTGAILPGGVDTQKEWYGTGRNLSARYILEGTDHTGQSCRIFIENNGNVAADGSVVTEPKLLTDSLALSYLETTKLTGTISPSEDGVIIHIMTEE